MIKDLRADYPELDDEGIIGIAQNSLGESKMFKESAEETIATIYKNAFGDKYKQSIVDDMIKDLRKKYPDMDDEGIIGIAQNALGK